MPDEAELQDSIGKTYLGLLLLTADASAAETAITQSLLSPDLDDLFSESFVIRAARLALRLNRNHAGQSYRGFTIKMPVELQRLLRLPAELRHCFVLELLMDIGRPACADLLRVSAEQVCARTCAAVVELARMAGVRVKAARVTDDTRTHDVLAAVDGLWEV